MMVLFWATVLLCSVGAAATSLLDSNSAPYNVNIPLASDPVSSIEVVHPAHGAIEKAPVGFDTQITIRPEGAKLFAAQYKNAVVCVEANGVVVDCSQIGKSEFRYHQVGSCTVRAYLTRSGSLNAGNQMFDFESAPISFTLMNEPDYDELIARAIRNNEAQHRPGFRQSLIEWANLQRKRPDGDILKRLEIAEPSRRNNTAVQRDLRQLYLTFLFDKLFEKLGRVNRHYPKDEVDKLTEEAKLRAIWEAIELEKRVYRDLMTDELDCEDSYFRLADKTKEFLHFAAPRYPTAKFAMVADDDLYLRLDKISARLQHQSKRYYAGHVRAIEDATKQRPIRDPESRNVLSRGQYSLNELPPYALGANFFLSMDCVEFVAKNSGRLRDLGGMDDISVALWMLIMQVHPKPFNGLKYLNSGTCRDDLASLSDLTESAIRVIHANIQQQRRFCHDFQRNVWLRQDIGAPAEGQPRLLSFDRENVYFDFTIPTPTESWAGQLMITVSTKTRAGVKVSFFPANETFHHTFLRKVCVQVQLNFPSAITTCAGIRNRIRTQLLELYVKLAANTSVDPLQLKQWKVAFEQT